MHVHLQYYKVTTPCLECYKISQRSSLQPRGCFSRVLILVHFSFLPTTTPKYITNQKHPINVPQAKSRGNCGIDNALLQQRWRRSWLIYAQKFTGRSPCLILQRTAKKSSPCESDLGKIFLPNPNSVSSIISEWVYKWACKWPTMLRYKIEHAHWLLNVIPINQIAKYYQWCLWHHFIEKE